MELMTKDEPQSLFSQFDGSASFEEEEAWSSTISPNPSRISYPPKPTTFSWPKQVEFYVRELYNHNFHLRPREINPYFFTNGNNGHLGRESYEVYGFRLPNHPEPSSAVAPDFNEIFKRFHDIRNPIDSTGWIEPKFLKHSAFPTQQDHVVVITFFHAGPFSCGPPGFVHGGLLSAFCDTLSYEAVLESRVAVTASLNMNFKSPTPINSLIIAISSVQFVGDRKAFARCAIFNEDLSILHVEATATFITPTKWVGMKSLQYGISNNTHFDNSKTEDQLVQPMVFHEANSNPQSPQQGL